MFSFKALSLIAVTAIFGGSFAQAQLADGRYRILNGDQSARSFPGGHQGPFESIITMSGQFASVFEQWDVNSDGSGGYIIQSTATGANAFANSSLNEFVFAASNQQSTWFIEQAGSNGQAKLYVIKVPNQDLLWTNTLRPNFQNDIVLKGADGSAAQRFVFGSTPRQ